MTALSPDLLNAMNTWWRAANYLSVGLIYLPDNPLLKERLQPLQISRACSPIPARRQASNSPANAR
jgi:phosphoketolase